MPTNQQQQQSLPQFILASQQVTATTQPPGQHVQQASHITTARHQQVLVTLQQPVAFGSRPQHVVMTTASHLLNPGVAGNALAHSDSGISSCTSHSSNAFPTLTPIPRVATVTQHLYAPSQGNAMMVVPQAATLPLNSHATTTQSASVTTCPWAVVTSTAPVLQQSVTSRELQTVRHPSLGSSQVVIQPPPSLHRGNQSPVASAGMAVAFPMTTAVVSASGGTIHHLGRSPTRVSSHNPAQHTSIIMSSQHNSQAQQVNLQGLAATGNLPNLTTVMSTIPAPQSPRLPVVSSSHGASVVAAAAAAATPLLERLAATSFETTLPGLLNPGFTSPIQSPEKRPRKRLKLEEQPAPNVEIGTKRKLICDEKLKDMARLRESYREHLTELFFLQNGGNMMDYLIWKRKPTVPLAHFLKSGDLDSDDEEYHNRSVGSEVNVGISSGGYTPVATPVATATTLPASVSAISNQHTSDPSKRPGGRHSIVFGHVQGTSPSQHAPQIPGGHPLNTSAATTTVGSSPPCTISNSASNPSGSLVTSITTVPSFTSTQTALTKLITDDSSSVPSSQVTSSQVTGMVQSMKSPKLALSPTRLATRQHSISAVYDNQIGTQEAIVERAKQEAQVMQRITELRREGLWSTRRLPKVQEPPRGKAHWDYLLEEMTWLAADFAQERKWKKAGCRKIARMICKYHQEQHQKEQKAEKDEVLKLKRISGSLAKMVREFWQNIEKVVQYKQTSRLEEKRKKALDLHLSFIVDQTEKYSTWLTEGIGGSSSIGASSTSASPLHSAFDDGDFEPDQSGSDDEETIEMAEQEGDLDEVNTEQEIEYLHKEGEIPLEELLKSLPKEVLEKPASLSGSENESEHTPIAKRGEKPLDDDIFKSSDEDSSDDETTVEEQERKEKKPDYSQELNDLEKEGEMSIDELRKAYAAAYDSDFELDETESEAEEEDSESSNEEEEEEEEELEEPVDQDVGIEYLAKILDQEDSPVATETEKANALNKDPGGPNKDITDIAETAMSIQPTGYTLETTKVHTVVPFLLKHELREYQHVGLDWLATLHERRLNGILADEMGLGKTIQTIAQLSHLACEKGVWGPHLIVVPTSVMLNWEMELKKWCPAFKILTYYGNQKERKQKRTGWTKTNAFHICITSYKLVIQDHQSFRRKKWKYFILDEAQNIKNFKSQRWQTLLNFSSQRRLLLTGTPLQNSLMELWSLMHFLMPHVFQSHKEFKEWFANPLSGMIEGSREYNENLIKRLHKVLRPFLLRRLKKDVEKQMPQKFEHVVKCRLSKRQRFLYDDFMSQTKTKETLESGHFMSVINILMQLRKVCNHPNLFDPRPINSPLQVEGISFTTASVVLKALEKDPLEYIDLRYWHPALVDMEIMTTAGCNRTKQLQTPQKLIVEIDSQPELPHLQPVEKSNKQFIFRSFSPLPTISGRSSPFVPVPQRSDSPFVVTSAISSQQSLQAHMELTTAATTTSDASNLPPQILQARVAPQPQAINGPTNVSSVKNITPTSNSTASSGFILQQKSTLVLQVPANTANSVKPVVKVSPMAVTCSSGNAVLATAEKHKLPTSSLDSVKKTAADPQSPLYLESLVEKRASCHEATLQRIAQHNQKYCSARPVFGSDLHAAVQVLDKLSVASDTLRWQVHGLVHCSSLQKCRQNVCKSRLWNSTKALENLIHTPEEYLEELKDILTRFVFVIPRATAPRIRLHMSHPPPSYIQEQRHMKYVLHRGLSHKAAKLHCIQSRMAVQFPELRLIQYDCGKLQTLDILLRQLKSGSHRVLIFTQMTRMLDIFEQFLNYHGHRYLRLDGTTKVEQRQMLMERFNADKKIFVFILSTRSGGIGVNLTGADTVIFYDSDWNPTMDAQAQDRCHRIGQTRDVHIYRLICDKTIEENILKKANQKRLLGDVAIEGGNFTTAFFRQNTIKELFDEPSGLESLQKEVNDKVATAPTVSSRRERAAARAKDASSPQLVQKKELSDDQMEQALGAAEEDTDIQAAKVVKAEQKAELAEFDESIPWDEKEAELKREHEELSKVEEELSMLDKELKPVERYAVTFTETQMAPVTTEELQKAEEEVVLAKEEWELSHLKALKEEEERRAELEEDEMLFTYSRDDAYNQVKKKNKDKPTKASQRRETIGGGGMMEDLMRKDAIKNRERGRRSLGAEKGLPLNAAKANLHELVKKSNLPGRKRKASFDSVVSEDSSVASSDRQPEMSKEPVKRKQIKPAQTMKQKSYQLAVNNNDSPKLKSLNVKTKSPPTVKTMHNEQVVSKVIEPEAKQLVKSNKVKSPNKTASPKNKLMQQKIKSPVSKSSSIVPQPWSNPNLVIRTRKARSSEGTADGNEVDVTSVHNGKTAVVANVSTVLTTAANAARCLPLMNKFTSSGSIVSTVASSHFRQPAPIAQPQLQTFQQVLTRKTLAGGTVLLVTNPGQSPMGHAVRVGQGNHQYITTSQGSHLVATSQAAQVVSTGMQNISSVVQTPQLRQVISVPQQVAQQRVVHVQTAPSSPHVQVQAPPKTQNMSQQKIQTLPRGTPVLQVRHLVQAKNITYMHSQGTASQIQPRMQVIQQGSVVRQPAVIQSTKAGSPVCVVSLQQPVSTVASHNHTVPILEKFAMQLTGSTNILQSSPGHTVCVASGGTLQTVLQSPPSTSASSVTLPKGAITSTGIVVNRGLTRTLVGSRNVGAVGSPGPSATRIVAPDSSLMRSVVGSQSVVINRTPVTSPSRTAMMIQRPIQILRSSNILPVGHLQVPINSVSSPNVQNVQVTCAGTTLVTMQQLQQAHQALQVVKPNIQIITSPPSNSLQ